MTHTNNIPETSTKKNHAYLFKYPLQLHRDFNRKRAAHNRQQKEVLMALMRLYIIDRTLRDAVDLRLNKESGEIDQ